MIQHTILKAKSSFCLVIGILSLITLLVGLLTPSGKFSFVQALMIPQIICFSFLQFEILPLPYLGFNNLFLSNGFNNLSFETSEILPTNIYQFFGLSETSFISNYNITFGLICATPFIFGLILLIILKAYRHLS
jgi:hypothetical protein